MYQFLAELHVSACSCTALILSWCRRVFYGSATSLFEKTVEWSLLYFVCIFCLYLFFLHIVALLSHPLGLHL